jgi:hypothetical protein
VAFKHGPAGAAEVLAMPLQAGRHLEFVGKDLLAKPMRVAAAGSFLSGSMRLRPRSAGTSNEGDEKTETPNHDHFLHEKQREKARRAQHSAEWGCIETR